MIIGQGVSVLGGGIAGLSCAVALAQRGIKVRVIEQAGELGEIGAGLQLSPNGMAVLRALGLEPGIIACSTPNRGLDLRNGVSGGRLIRLAMAGEGFRFIHRADLIAVLARAAADAGVRIDLGRRVVRVVAGTADSTLFFESGGHLKVGLLIGADGVRALSRGRLNRAEPPFFTGQVAWRALIPARADEPPEAVLHVGPGRHLVRYPLAGRGLVNLVGVEERDAWAEESWHATDDPDNFRRAFGGFCDAVQIDLARVDEVNLWGLFRHRVASRWHNGAAVLIGDAAHPTLPFLAQGANLALEDAWTLADCLTRDPVAQALDRFQTLRQARVTRAIDAANASAANYHLSGPRRVLAHAGLRVLNRIAPSLMLRRFDWLYGHNVTAGHNVTTG